MRDVINQSTIWRIVGNVSAINGLICFALSSTYKISFGKLGFVGLLVYILVSLFMWFLILGAKRIQVSEKVKGFMAALIFDLICLISVLHDKLVTGKSDVLSIISYGSFALMSLSMSRKFELGFETGFSSFFLSLFATQLFKINRKLLPIALLFCSALIILRHYSESGVQFGSTTPYHFRHPNAAVIEIGNEDINEESQDSTGMGDNEQNNNQEESSEVTHHFQSNYGQVSEGSTLHLDSEQNNGQDDQHPFSLLPKSSNQDHVSSAITTQNGWMHSSGHPELISAASPMELLRDCGGAAQLNMWKFQGSEGMHLINPRVMYDPSRRVWVYLEEATLVFRIMEEADLELTMRPEMRILVKKPEVADSEDDSKNSSPTSVFQLREEDAEEEEQEEEEEGEVRRAVV